jgi:uncharacterized C2H2 Zn-finger protein
MSFLKNLKAIIKPPVYDRNYWFFVKCDHCGEIIRARIDMHNHLSLQYGEGKDGNTYYCRKVVIGSKRCYRPIEVEFTFDANRRLQNRQIKGGVFVTEDEYLAAQPDSD